MKRNNNILKAIIALIESCSFLKVDISSLVDLIPFKSQLKWYKSQCQALMDMDEKARFIKLRATKITGNNARAPFVEIRVITLNK